MYAALEELFMFMRMSRITVSRIIAAANCYELHGVYWRALNWNLNSFSRIIRIRIVLLESAVTFYQLYFGMEIGGSLMLLMFLQKKNHFYRENVIFIGKKWFLQGEKSFSQEKNHFYREKIFLQEKKHFSQICFSYIRNAAENSPNKQTICLLTHSCISQSINYSN